MNLRKKNVAFNWKSASIVDIINCLEFNNELIAMPLTLKTVPEIF